MPSWKAASEAADFWQDEDLSHLNFNEVYFTNNDHFLQFFYLHQFSFYGTTFFNIFVLDFTLCFAVVL